MCVLSYVRSPDACASQNTPLDAIASESCVIVQLQLVPSAWGALEPCQASLAERRWTRG